MIKIKTHEDDEKLFGDLVQQVSQHVIKHPYSPLLVITPDRHTSDRVKSALLRDNLFSVQISTYAQALNELIGYAYHMTNKKEYDFSDKTYINSDIGYYLMYLLYLREVGMPTLDYYSIYIGQRIYTMRKHIGFSGISPEDYRERYSHYYQKVFYDDESRKRLEQIDRYQNIIDAYDKMCAELGLYDISDVIETARKIIRNEPDIAYNYFLSNYSVFVHRIDMMPPFVYEMSEWLIRQSLKRGDNACDVYLDGCDRGAFHTYLSNDRSLYLYFKEKMFAGEPGVEFERQEVVADPSADGEYKIYDDAPEIFISPSSDNHTWIDGINRLWSTVLKVLQAGYKPSDIVLITPNINEAFLFELRYRAAQDDIPILCKQTTINVVNIPLIRALLTLSSPLSVFYALPFDTRMHLARVMFTVFTQAALNGVVQMSKLYAEAPNNYINPNAAEKYQLSASDVEIYNKLIAARRNIFQSLAAEAFNIDWGYNFGEAFKWLINNVDLLQIKASAADIAIASRLSRYFEVVSKVQKHLYSDLRNKNKANLKDIASNAYLLMGSWLAYIREDGALPFDAYDSDYPYAALTMPEGNGIWVTTPMSYLRTNKKHKIGLMFDISNSWGSFSNHTGDILLGNKTYYLDDVQQQIRLMRVIESDRFNSVLKRITEFCVCIELFLNFDGRDSFNKGIKEMLHNCKDLSYLEERLGKIENNPIYPVGIQML